MYNQYNRKMTKADIVKNISDQTGVDKTDVQMIAEKFMDEIKSSLQNNKPWPLLLSQLRQLKKVMNYCDFYSPSKVQM